MHPGWDLNPGPNGLQSSQRHVIHHPRHLLTLSVFIGRIHFMRRQSCIIQHSALQQIFSTCDMISWLSWCCPLGNSRRSESARPCSSRSSFASLDYCCVKVSGLSNTIAWFFGVIHAFHTTYKLVFRQKPEHVFRICSEGAHRCSLVRCPSPQTSYF